MASQAERRQAAPFRFSARQISAIAAAVAAVIGGTWTVGQRVYQTGSDVQGLRDEVRIYGRANCEATAKVVTAIRVELARAVPDPQERRAALELFPVVVCGGRIVR